jgi:hypothetical protein
MCCKVNPFFGNADTMGERIRRIFPCHSVGIFRFLRNDKKKSRVNPPNPPNPFSHRITTYLITNVFLSIPTPLIVNDFHAFGSTGLYF